MKVANLKFQTLIKKRFDLKLTKKKKVYYGVANANRNKTNFGKFYFSSASASGCVVSDPSKIGLDDSSFSRFDFLCLCLEE